MQKIIAFSKYLSYMLGGAEKSTYEILKKDNKTGKKITLVSFNGIRTFGAKDKKVNFPDSWEVNYINNVLKFSKFFYWEYFFNRFKLSSYFKSLDSESILYTYAIYAPIAINNFEGTSKLFIRSESDLGINKNYQKGFKRILKKIYMFIEYPAFQVYKRDLKMAINKSEIICNSKFMSKKLKKLYNKDSIVMYPFIDENRLRTQFNNVKAFSKKGIVFVGDSIIKGMETAKSLAKIMPNEEFYFFSRFVDKEIKNDNVTWIPWQKNEVDIYKYAKTVIVPSICEEAYGRVSREAYILKIPTLVSNLGGLPESVNYEAKFIINDFKSIKEWKKRIESFN